MNFLRNLFAPTVDSLTASLSKTVTRLQDHAERQAAKSGALHDKADDIREQAHAAAGESIKATARASRIGSLLA